MSCERPSARIDRNTEEESYTIKDAVVFWMLYMVYAASAAIMAWFLNRH
jgi:hypothetical protein